MTPVDGRCNGVRGGFAKMRFKLASSALAAMLTLGGCADADDPAAGLGGEGTRAYAASRQRLDNVSYHAAFDSAVHALSQWFEGIAADPATGRITAAPSENTEPGGTGRLRDEVAGFRNRVRRQAAMTVLQQGDSIVVDCRVTRQRLDTADHRAFAHQRSARDEDPTAYTPIQGEASATAEQAQVWTDIGRDRRLEQEILGVVRDRLLRGSRPAAPSGE
ncbi:MAG: hypothetical protein HUU22_10950 [Phycisphaerae bacterium]|nr:hypothetical protein [Phycisphaerae bacterium]NUQ46540.1 hypothetical protein [Phycisphaerae bacterium]